MMITVELDLVKLGKPIRRDNWTAKWTAKPEKRGRRAESSTKCSTWNHELEHALSHRRLLTPYVVQLYGSNTHCGVCVRVGPVGLAAGQIPFHVNIDNVGFREEARRPGINFKLESLKFLTEFVSWVGPARILMMTWAIGVSFSPATPASQILICPEHESFVDDG